MTDAAIGEMPIEPVPPIPPPPEAIAEVEAAPPQAEVPAAPAPPEPDEPVASSADVETEAVESFDPRIEIPESLGPVRRAILEGLIDGEGALSVAELHALMPLGTPRGTAEAAILREYRSGRILRTSPGRYTLAPVQPSKPARLAPPPAPSPEEEQVWGDAIELWIIDPESWNRAVLGPRPNEPGRRIPADIVAKGVDRSRKREARRRDADEAAAKRAAVDRELRDKLLAATGGNFQPGPALDDMIVVREILRTVPLDRVIMTIKQKVDRRSYPGNPPLVSWRDPAFLRAVAEDFCRAFAIPGLVREWGNAGKASAPKTQSSPAGEMPDDIDELRRHHDNPHAPPGPHSLTGPDARR
jgi:hypothetical protein